MKSNALVTFCLLANGKISKYIPDINECLGDQTVCDQTCTNTAGSYFCRCRNGYSLDLNDRKTCNGEVILLSHFRCC